MAEMFKNGFKMKWQKMAGNSQNWLEWLEMAKKSKNGWNLLQFAGHLLELTGIAVNG